MQNTYSLWKLKRQNGGSLPFTDVFDFSGMSGSEEIHRTITLYAQSLKPELVGAKNGALSTEDHQFLIGQRRRHPASARSTEHDVALEGVSMFSPTEVDLAKYADILADIPWPSVKATVKNSFRNALALKPVFPPQFDNPSLSFLGGLPIATDALAWPSTSQGNLYCNFIGQIDCASLPDFEQRDLLPKEGVLYFFADFSEGLERSDHLVRYQPFSTNAQEILPPGPLSSSELPASDYKTVWQWELDLPTNPRSDIFPKREVTTHPILQAFAMPDVADVLQDASPILLPEEQDTELFMEQVQSRLNARGCEEVFENPKLHKSICKKDDTGRAIGFDGFPQNWLAVETVMGLLENQIKSSFEEIERVLRTPWIEEGDVEALENLEVILQDQRAQKARAASRHEMAAVVLEIIEYWKEQAQHKGTFSALNTQERNFFWETWREFIAFEAKNFISLQPDYSYLDNAIKDATEHSCVSAIFSEGYEDLPKSVFRNFENRLLANPYMPNPDPMMEITPVYQIFGTPRATEGNKEWSKDICLLQVCSDNNSKWNFGDGGTLHYWISEEDLEALRFDKVKVTIG